MRELIQQIFKAYGFGEKWQDDSIEFYAAESEDKTSFFLIDYIEATCEGITDVEMLTMLKQLEKDYIDENTNGKGVKRKIQELFVNDNASIAAQIDKNTSAIYPIKLESLNNLDKYRKITFCISSLNTIELDNLLMLKINCMVYKPYRHCELVDLCIDIARK